MTQLTPVMPTRSNSLPTRRRSDGWVAFVYLLPAFLFLGIYIAYPILDTIYNSFYKWSGISNIRTFIGLDNFIQLWQDPVFGKAFVHNFIFLGFAILVILPFSFFIAFVLARMRLRIRSLFQTLFFFPVVLNLVVVGTLWDLFYNPQIGLLNTLLQAIGLNSLALPWLGDQKLALPALLLVSLWMRSGYYIVVYISGIEGIPGDIWDALAIDGAGQVRSAISVIVPMLRPVIAATVTMVLISTFNDFGMVWVMTQGGPIHATEILGTDMFKEAFTQLRMGYASAIVLVMLAISLILSVIQMRTLEKGVVQY
jgi:ABC-type sugar transport system permease subunit